MTLPIRCPSPPPSLHHPPHAFHPRSPHTGLHGLELAPRAGGRNRGDRRLTHPGLGWGAAREGVGASQQHNKYAPTKAVAALVGAGRCLHCGSRHQACPLFLSTSPPCHPPAAAKQVTSVPMGWASLSASWTSMWQVGAAWAFASLPPSAWRRHGCQPARSPAAMPAQPAPAVPGIRLYILHTCLCAAGGFNPGRVLPCVVDVGTNNERLRQEPW